MAKKIVTLYVDDASLRLLVVQGKRIKKWADSPLEAGLVKSNVVINEAEVAARVKQLFKTQKVRTKKVIVGLSGLHCLTRPITLPPLPRAMLDEAVAREAKRVLPVPLEQLYISWQILPASEGKLQVFIVAVPCKTADSLLKTLRQAGLKPYLMDLKPLALARVVSEEATAIIVDLQPTEFDIIIMVDGVPQLIRTVALPNETQSLGEKSLMLREELSRTLKFYSSSNPEKPLASGVSIFVSGQLADEPELRKSLSDESRFTVLPLSSPSRYIVNRGLVLKEQRGSGTGPSIVNVNVLPTSYRPKPVSLVKIIALPSAIAFIGLTVLLTTFIQDASANVASVRSQLESTNNLLAQKQSKQKELTKNIAELEKKLANTQASRNTFAAALGSLDKQHERINGDLQVTISALPNTISLTNISQTADKLIMQGRSPNEMEVLSYARSLEASGRFSEITIASIRRVGNDEMDFVLALKTKG